MGKPIHEEKLIFCVMEKPIHMRLEAWCVMEKRIHKVLKHDVLWKILSIIQVKPIYISHLRKG